MSDTTDNHAACVVAEARCVLLMTNSETGARLFPELVRTTVGDPGTPWDWEYNPLRPLAPPPR